jgi:polyvinyl alcohol dehydrogenase (cytochrome)
MVRAGQRMVAALLPFVLALVMSAPAQAAPATAADEAAQAWAREAPSAAGPFAAGAQAYRVHCAACHDSGAGRAPHRRVLRDMTPAAIRRSLVQGVMREQGAALDDAGRTAIAEYLTGRRLAVAAATPASLCRGEAARFDFAEPPPFTGWGLDPAGSHAVAPQQAGITRASLGRLRLRWAFAFAGSERVRSQPALAGGAILVGAHNGMVHALDRRTGCQRWSFEAEAEVRTGIVVAPWRKGDTPARPLAFFGDVVGNAYALDARTGALVWKVQADDHPAATLTAAPTLHEGTLYVPVSSSEEAAAASPGYVCCTFRGSVLALDAATGAVKWRTWMVEPASERGTSQSGLPKLGPSGAAVWNSPAIDARRGQLTIATSDNYSVPASGMSDAIVALDLATGRIRWHHQTLAGDIWNVACVVRTSDACPDPAGPDFGFGAGTVLAKGRDGRDYVLAGQKSGWAFAVDPDTGREVWRQRVGRGGVAAGIYFGMAAADGRLFVPVSDRPDGKAYDFPASPGLHALDIASGRILWRAPAPDVCAGRETCFPGYGGAITTTGELVFAGSDDGHLRIHDAGDGTVLWDEDTARAFPTVNGIEGRGGAISGGAAPIAWGGDLIVASGYGYASKMPGNLLLVYGVDRER